MAAMKLLKRWKALLLSVLLLLTCVVPSAFAQEESAEADTLVTEDAPAGQTDESETPTWQPDTTLESLAEIVTPENLVAQKGGLRLYFHESRLDFAVVDEVSGLAWSNAVDRTQYTADVPNQTAVSQLLTVTTSSKISENQQVIYDKAKNGSSVTTIVEKIADGVKIHFTLKKVYISFAITFTLGEGWLQVDIPMEEIEESGEETLMTIAVMPFFAAAENREGDYIFYPDGSGALMEFTTTDRFSSPLILDYYGNPAADFTLETEREEAGTQSLIMPVFGIKSGDGAVLANIVGGAAEANLTVAPGGYIYTGLNRIYPTFRFRRRYTYSDENGVTQNYKDVDLIDCSRTIRYTFLTGDEASYSGMASAYRKYLLEEGGMEKTVQPGDATLNLSFFMGISEKQMFFSHYVTMTTFSQVEDILSAFQEAGIHNLSAGLMAWNKGGYDVLPTSANPEGKLGGKSGLKELLEFTAAGNIDTYLFADLFHGNSDSGSYNLRQDAVRDYPGFIVTNDKENRHYINTRSVLEKFLPGLFKQHAAAQNLGFSFETMAQQLYYDFNTRGSINREQAMKHVVEMLKQAKESGYKTAVTGGNVYAAACVDRIMELPQEDSLYTISSRSIPFAHLVFHGIVPYTTAAGNTSFDLQYQFLKWVEQGAEPYFILTHENTEKLRDTSYKKLFSSRYDLWSDEIVEYYTRYNELMKPVMDQAILSHESVEKNLIRVRYENGYTVYINYADEGKNIDGVEVEAMSARMVAP